MNHSAEASSAAPDSPPGSKPGHPIWERTREALIAVSLGNLFFVSAWFPLLYGGDVGYFKKTVTNNSLLAMDTNILCAAALVWLLLVARRRFRLRLASLAFDLAVLAVMLLTIDFCRRTLFHIQGVQVLASLKRPLVAAGALLAFMCALWQRRRIARAGSLVAELLSPLAIFILIHISLVILGAARLPEPTSTPALQPLNPTHPLQPRVLWIIFDETDYRLAFEARPANVRLPEFDRLRNESICATNAYPPGDRTLVSMPALISGQQATNATPKGVSDLEVSLARDGRAALWSQLPSVFASARELGFNTALIGWFHPYRRVLHRGLNYCNWYPYPGSFPAQEATFSSAIVSQIGCLVPGLQHERLYGNACRAIIADATSTATNADFGLTLLHLPPPHYPGVYLPEKDAFTVFPMPVVTGYFNNLALADRTLGKLRAAMSGRGQWEKTWIILSSDHSWRWSRLYDGRRDLRVPFLIKAPGQTTPLICASRINTVLTHDLILAILRGKVHSEADVAAWLDSQASWSGSFILPQESATHPQSMSE